MGLFSSRKTTSVSTETNTANVAAQGNGRVVSNAGSGTVNTGNQVTANSGGTVSITDGGAFKLVERLVADTVSASQTIGENAFSLAKSSAKDSQDLAREFILQADEAEEFSTRVIALMVVVVLAVLLVMGRMVVS